MTTVILSERGPRRFSVPGPHRQVFVCGVEVGGGESKDLRLLFNELQGHHASMKGTSSSPYIPSSTSARVLKAAKNSVGR
jgi:hypothetical protein